MEALKITGFELRPERERTGLFGRNRREDVLVRIEAEGGNIYLRKSTLEAAGGNWVRFRNKLMASAEKHGVPFVDYGDEA